MCVSSSQEGVKLRTPVPVARWPTVLTLPWDSQVQPAQTGSPHQVGTLTHTHTCARAHLMSCIHEQACRRAQKRRHTEVLQNDKLLVSAERWMQCITFFLALHLCVHPISHGCHVVYTLRPSSYMARSQSSLSHHPGAIASDICIIVFHRTALKMPQCSNIYGAAHT